MTGDGRGLTTAVAGTVPLLAGVLFFDWRFADLLVAAWVENVAVGVAALTRLGTTAALASPTAIPPDHRLLKSKVDGRSVPPGAVRVVAAVMAVFFCFHYGLFTFVHGAFTFGFAMQSEQLGIAAPTLGVAAVGLLLLRALLVHGVQLYQDFFSVQGWNDPSQALTAFHRPYLRVIPLHVTLIVAGVALEMLAAGEQILTLLLVTVFTVTDYVASRSGNRLVAPLGSVTTNVAPPPGAGS